MSKPKFDWERVLGEKLMERRGVEDFNYKKPLQIINKISCAYCEDELKDVGEKAEIEHLENCSQYIRAVRLGRIGNKQRFNTDNTSRSSLKSYIGRHDFPICLLGRVIYTRKFSGKVTKISEDLKKITLTPNVGYEKTFVIKILLDQATVSKYKV